ncbi:MAG: hypothetical protein V1734_03850, partial [Nanoarchaeota archaeon]
MNHLKGKVALLIAIVFSLCCIQLASAAIYYSPTYANVSENFMLNITISAPALTGNITQIIIKDHSPDYQQRPRFGVNYTSNSSSTALGIATFGVSPGAIMSWHNLTADGIVANGTNQSFTIWMNHTIAGAPASFQFSICMYNQTNIVSANWDCDSTDDPFVQGINITIGMNFGFSGYVKNDTGILQPNTNVTIYDYVLSAGGPPSEVPLMSALTDGNGLFSLKGINGSKTLYKIKLVYNNSVRATLVGPNLPPFP